MNNKVLIVYFSHEGEAYAGGKIVTLKIGNTKAAAQMMEKMTGADVFRIETVKPYPYNYMETVAIAEQLKVLPERVVVVDIGSWTIDIMPIQNGKPNEAECITSQQGLIRCMRTINEECNSG